MHRPEEEIDVLTACARSMHADIFRWTEWNEKKEADRKSDRQAGRQTEKQTSRQTEKQTSRQKAKQNDTRMGSSFLSLPMLPPFISLFRSAFLPSSNTFYRSGGRQAWVSVLCSSRRFC
mmetsp:Transcript_40934/g.80718  ORF Transcript_40934/g.80718 Transcript_40934/m.80718 type:complete len:119 (+) Transcript_40934:176-532(+)